MPELFFGLVIPDAVREALSSKIFMAEATMQSRLCSCMSWKLMATRNTLSQAATGHNVALVQNVPAFLFWSSSWKEHLPSALLIASPALSHCICQHFGLLALLLCFFASQKQLLVAHFAHHRVEQQRRERLWALAKKQWMERLGHAHT